MGQYDVTISVTEKRFHDLCSGTIEQVDEDEVSIDGDAYGVFNDRDDLETIMKASIGGDD